MIGQSVFTLVLVLPYSIQDRADCPTRQQTS